MSKLFETFAGEYVALTLKRDDKANVQDGKGNIKLLQNPMIINGYLFEEDDDYFYLAYEPNAEYLAIAVMRREVVTVESIEPDSEENEMAHILNDAVGPEDSGVN